ncbi:hypothetical protein ACFL0U_04665 [Pseudomonadota bacterium]
MGRFIKFLLKNNGNKEKYLNKTNAILLLLLALFLSIFIKNNAFAWFALTIAMFSSIGNDCIQTLGTFLTSNSNVKWWKLSIYIGLIFVIVVSLGWYNYGGEIHFERLNRIEIHANISTIQLLAPIILIILTLFGIPVSTTFLILSTFATQDAVESMLAKTFIAYIVAFTSAIAIWFIVYRYFAGYFLKTLNPKSELKWRIFQWSSTAMLWSAWLMQNTSNVAIFLPRRLEFQDLIIFLCIGLFAIFFILLNGGGPIQEIVNEKKDVIRVKSATFIDLFYALILFIFTQTSTTPMATTWVFLGLLGGREFALSYFTEGNERRYAKAATLISKDIALGSFGILISLMFVYFSRGL